MGGTTEGGAQRRTRRRDPEGRRRAIVSAAAALVAEDGLPALTHRRVAARAGVPLGATTYYFATLDEMGEAALAHLAQDVDRELREVARDLDAAGGDVRALARGLHEYLSQTERLRVDAALYIAGVLHDDMRPLALRWFDGLCEILRRHVDPATARALAVYSDGALVHAMLHDAPLPAAEIAAALERLVGGAGAAR